MEDKSSELLHIAVCNLSTVVSHIDAMRMAAACSYQLKHHVMPAWSGPHVAVSFVTSADHIMPGAEPVYILDNADQAGALGYHDVDPQGRPYARIFAKTVLDNGGVTMHGPLSVSVTLSHELCEMYGDPSADAWALDKKSGNSYALELCDAVENDSYQVHNCSVSNFLLPAFFNLGGLSKLDYLGLCKTAFETRPGGYQIVKDSSGNVSQVFSESYLDWKKPMKQRIKKRQANG